MKKAGDMNDLLRDGGDLERDVIRTPMPPPSDDDVPPILSEPRADADDAERGVPDEGRVRDATRIVQLAIDLDLFHTPDGQGFGSALVNERMETWALESRSCRLWLARLFYVAEEKAPGSQALTDAVAVLLGRAIHDAPERPVAVRVARAGADVYLDLADEARHVIRVTAGKWEVVANPPVRFRRPQGLLALPLPVRGGSIDDLRKLINVRDDGDFFLIVCWLVAVLFGRGPFPVLILSGEQGSAKTSTARVLRAQVDPSTAALRSPPRNSWDLIVSASNSHVIAFDNLSHVSPWLSDDLCRLATGAGFSARTHYTMTDETLFESSRPVILTGIDQPATRGDLLDRAVLVDLTRIAPDRRRTESELRVLEDSLRPGILGALLDLLAGALEELPNMPPTPLPRMADFARLGIAVEAVAGWPHRAFLDALDSNQVSSTTEALEGSPVAEGILKLVADREWSGSCSELLNALRDGAGTAVSARDWPSNARAMRAELKRLRPALRESGVQVGFPARTAKARRIVLRRTAPATDATVTPSPEAGGSPPVCN
jgi:hypothetical protein